MSDSSLLAFANERPANVTPYIASYQRPDFNAAGAIDTANKFGMAQRDMAAADLANNFNTKANPLKLEELQTQVHSAMDGASDRQKWDAWAKSQATDKSLQYALTQSPDQQDAAWQHAANALEAAGMITRDKAAEMRAVPADKRADYAGEVSQTAQAAHNYMTAYGGKSGQAGGDYPSLTQAEKSKIDTDAYYEAKTANGDNAPSTAQVDAARQIVMQRRGIAGGPAAPLPPAEAPASSSGYGPEGGVPGLVSRMGKNIATDVGHAYDWATGGGSPTPTATDKAGAAAEDAAKPPAAETPAEKPAGSVADDQTKWVKAMDSTGNIVDQAATFTGDATDAAAVKAWFNALPMGSAFIPPGKDAGINPAAQFKHSNFGE